MSAPQKIAVVTEWPLKEGWERDFLERKLLSEGIYGTQIIWLSLLDERPYAGVIFTVDAGKLEAGRIRLDNELRSVSPSVILTLGDYVTQHVTGKSGIDKHQSSIYRVGESKVIPCYPMSRVVADLSLQLWVGVAIKKAAAELRQHSQEPKYDFLLNPPLEQTLAFLRGIPDDATLSVDIETGRGQINTVGFAVSSQRAIAINALPDRLGTAAHWELWSTIRKILESERPKILQNFIYETLFFSRYGIRLRAVAHDTMICQKFLWPEFEMGLDAVGRMYTNMPYWKEDGKSWNNIRDWERHYEYNCKDTVGTYAGYLGQRRDLEVRNLMELHDKYLTRLFPAINEMCSRGIPLSEDALSKMRGEVATEIDGLLISLRRESGAETLNPRSPGQVKNFFKAKGYTIPKKYDSKEKKQKESTDEKSLKKLRMKYPEDKSLDYLLRLAKLGKAHSSYLSFKYDSDKRMRFSLNAHGTETGRFSGYCDPWDNGVNPQTIPGGNKGINIKSIFHSEPGYVFLQCDLRQAESRFVAYDSVDRNLIEMLEDPTKDIHKYVAAEIYGISVSEVTKQQRQLGKKSGHGANYSMKELTFIDSCISEMDLVLTKSEATKVLEAYHKLFPGIRAWHASLRRELSQTRKLRTPLGRERYFYGRLDDDTFRQAYAYRPQSTIPDITNHLMLHLLDCREAKRFDFRLLLQCHDSVLLEVPVAFVPAIAAECWATEKWHPEIILPGGRLIIPTEVEVGTCYGDLTKYEGESADGRVTA